MTTSPEITRRAQVRAWQTIATLFAILAVLGAFSAPNIELFLAYLAVLSTALLPSAMWVKIGSRGIPTWPAVSMAHAPYFAFPIVSGHETVASFSDADITTAAYSVAAYLLIATIAWRVVSGKPRAADLDHATAIIDFVPTKQLIYIGLGMGILFWLAIVSSSLGFIGALFGVLRSLVLTFVMIACFLVGVTRAQGLLRGSQWYLCLAGIAMIIALSWTTFFLVAGIMYILAAAFGYVVVKRSVPLGPTVAGLILIAILHAGKGEMRQKYWIENTNFGGPVSALQLPMVAAEWVGEGLLAIANGDAFGRGALDRASMLHMILRTQTLAPDSVPFLNGQTYAMLPSILVPRFIDPDKPASQIGMDLLNIHYGLLTVEGAATTAIGWGLIAEAHANFGMAGIYGIAILLGGFCGILARLSSRSDILSLSSLLSIAAMMTLLSIEADLIQLALSLLQASAAVVMFYVGYGWLLRRHKLQLNTAFR